MESVALDELDLKLILDKPMLYILDEMNKNDLDITKLIDTRVYGNTELLTDMYLADYKEMKLYTYFPETNMNYRIFMYFDLDYLHDIQNNINENKHLDKYKLLEKRKNKL